MASREIMSLVHFCLAAVFVWFSFAFEQPPLRPKITGIAHVRIYSTNLANSRHFYGKIIGLVPIAPGGAGPAYSCYAVNDHQQIQIFSASAPAKSNFLAEVAFATDDVGKMRRYLTAHHIPAGVISKD